MLALPQEFIGSTCEVKSMENEMLAVGHIIKIDEDALEISSRDDDRIPLIQYRTPVKLYVHHPRLEARILVGAVYLSTENFLRLEGVRSLQDFERRGAFRVNAAVPARLTAILNDDERAEYNRRLGQASGEAAQAIMAEHTLNVKVMDISLSGVRLQSATALIPGARYTLEFTPLDKPMVFFLKVQRLVHMPNGETQYGCIFFDYTERLIDDLCRDLFQLQRLEKNRRRNAAGAL